MTDYYVFAEVTPKNGVMRHIHRETLGSTCYILEANVGDVAWIEFEPEYDPGTFHRMHTSIVEKIEKSDDGKRITITTMNTVYVLEYLYSKGV